MKLIGKPFKGVSDSSLDGYIKLIDPIVDPSILKKICIDMKCWPPYIFETVHVRAVMRDPSVVFVSTI